MSKDSEKLIPCFLCGNGAEIKTTKKNKPYFMCEPCGVQVFIRRKKGISRLNELLKSIGTNAVNYSGAKGRVLDLVAQINRLAELKGKLKEIQDKKGLMEFLTGDRSFSIAEKALEKEIHEIEISLNAYLQASGKANN